MAVPIEPPHGRGRMLELMAWAVVALHAAFAVTGGVHPSMVARWLLVAAMAAGAGLTRWARLRGPFWLTLPSLALLWLPVVVTWPVAALSLAGLAALALLALTSAVAAVELVRDARVRPPPHA